jgi:hypothetical protein
MNIIIKTRKKFSVDTIPFIKLLVYYYTVFETILIFLVFRPSSVPSSAAGSATLM